jgi:hypothetical protein
MGKTAIGNEMSGGWSVEERHLHPSDVGVEGEKRRSIPVLIEIITDYMMHCGSVSRGRFGAFQQIYYMSLCIHDVDPSV